MKQILCGFKQFILSHSSIHVKYRDVLGSSDSQFGFEFGHNTDLCVFNLKQVIEFYYALSRPANVCI